MKNLLLLLLLLAPALRAQTMPAALPGELTNPILPGYFADPSLVECDGKFYLFVTADPWGTDFLSCWVSDDFRNWTFHRLNWPTKQACTSPTSNGNMVWAPSVIRKGDSFYMYISVGSEVWCGRAAHPLGPWENMLSDVPMIGFDTSRFYHVIDAEAFTDDDGRSYLYWGSGWDWKNGHCFAAELNDDMCSFRTAPVEVTPPHYFEGPLMTRRNGRYYLTYSEGKTIDETYEVRYAVGDSPLGPFAEAANSPILTMNDSLRVYGPGHHTLFAYGGRDYILYHRHRLPFVRGQAYRQTCINELTFDEATGEIDRIIPHHTQAFPAIGQADKGVIGAVALSASSQSAPHTAPVLMADGSYATRWEAAEDDREPWVMATFEPATYVGQMELRFEYPWMKYFVKAEVSDDGQVWDTLVDTGVSGSPVVIAVDRACRFVRLKFAAIKEAAHPSLWEWRFKSTRP